MALVEIAHKKLCNQDGAMCCLGVACDVIGTGWWRAEDPENTYGRWVYVEEFLEDGITVSPTHGNTWNDQLLTDRVREQLGLTRLEEKKLTDLNDREMASFSQIANYVESILEARS